MSKKDLLLRWLAVILFLLFIGECKSTKRIQRRFMWKQVDDTMDGIFDSMASSARAMKSMIGELIPGMSTAPTHNLMHSNIMDYLPSETTKIKYIIRSPTTKPMKVIKMSAPKRVVKIMTIHKPIVETNHSRPKYNFGDAAALRQMEKEQELIAEGRLPIKTAEKNHNHNNEVVSGKIHEFSSDWQPISTAKSYPMSHLYTNALSEGLPQPEKQVYDPANEIANVYEETKRKNKYEVTENTPEESVAVPYTEHYQNSRGFIPIRSSHSSNHQHTARFGLSHVPTTPTTATTTTEAPNYPASFLKKNRERPALAPKQIKVTHEIHWVRPSNSSILEVKQNPTQLMKFPLRSQNWPVIGPTILPTMQELSTTTKLRKPEPLVQTTSEERLRPKPTKNLKFERPRDIKQRGSVKFGDKLSELYKK